MPSRVDGRQGRRLADHEFSAYISTMTGTCEKLARGRQPCQLHVVAGRLAVAGLLVASAAPLDAGSLSVDLSASWADDARTALATGACFTAKSLVQQALTAGDPIGFVVRAEMHESGRCARRRPSKAVRDYAEAARRDQTVGYARLGYLVLNGVGVPEDRAFADLLFKQTALGTIYMSPQQRRWLVRRWMAERPVPAELEGALAWLEEIENGAPKDLLEAARRLKTGGGGWPRNEAVARSWLRDAAIAGLTEARFELAQWLLADPSSAEDVQHGLSHLWRAAVEGHLPALLEYGRRLAEGHGVVQNDLNAYLVLLRARAAGGDIDALLEGAERLSLSERRLALELNRLPNHVPYFTPRRTKVPGAERARQ